MCTGIVHVYTCCQCNNVVYKITDGVQGYTCYRARMNNRRGACPTGISFSHYNRVAEGDCCVFCEIFLGGELDNLTAENCSQGRATWPEDKEDRVLLRPRRKKDRDDKLAHKGGGADSDEDYNDDEEEGGAKL